MTSEQWKPVQGFDDYAVSDAGRVKRVRDSAKGAKAGDFVKPRPNERGYLRVGLCRSGRPHDLYIHRIVAQAFIGCPSKTAQTVNHKNGDKTDNRVENLEWTSNAANIRHCYEILGYTGRRAKESYRRVLSESDAYNVLRGRWIEGRSNRQLARQYGVHEHTIMRVAFGRTWKKAFVKFASEFPSVAIQASE